MISIPEFVQKTVNKYVRQWQNTIPLTFSGFPTLNEGQHSDKEVAELMQRLISKIRNRNLKPADIPLIEESLFQLIRTPPSFISRDAFRQTTLDFIRQARDFNPGMPLTEIYQAIRNVWIANSIQHMFDERTSLSRSVFAYSMLYPYSDNLIDSKEVARQEKAAFNARFRKKLSGKNPSPQHPIEKDIFRLVGLIEAEYDRRNFPQVYQSLLAIHGAQEDSVALSAPTPPPPDQIIQLTFAKGGASTLADGYLVNDRMSAKEADFIMAYGIFLQLLDDLQDISEDLEQRQTTLFTIHAGQKPLDEEAARTLAFMSTIIADAAGLFTGKEEFWRLIKHSCTLLAYRSIVNQPEYFSPSFVRFIDSRSPVSQAFYKRQKETLKEINEVDLNIAVANLSVQETLN